MSTENALVASHLTPANTIGAVEIGTVLAIFLFGILSAQVYHYLKYCDDDSRSLRVLVSVVWLVELAHSAWIFHSLWIITMRSAGDLSPILDIPWTLKSSVIWALVSSSIVSAFYAWRIKRLSQRWEITLLCFVLGLIRVAIVLTAVSWLFKISFLEFVIRKKYLFILASVSEALLDLCLASSLAYWLQKRKSPSPRYDKTVGRSIIFSFETGTITTIFCFLIVPVFLLLQNLVWLCIWLITSKLYGISLMVSLNTRRDYALPITAERSGGMAFMNRFSHRQAALHSEAIGPSHNQESDATAPQRAMEIFDDGKKDIGGSPLSNYRPSSTYGDN